MKALHKKIISAVLICALLIVVAVSVSKNRSSGGTGEAYAQGETEEKETPEDTARQQADTDLVFWYSDPSYASFFEEAAKQYYAATKIKVSVEYQETLDYMGDIYDKTMQDAGFPDVYLISGDNLEAAYLYGLASVNATADAYEAAAVNAQNASVYQNKMLGYPLSYNTCLFIYQTGYFEAEPNSLQAIIEYSNENEPEEHVQYLLEWDVNDAFYDFPFISNSVSFEKNQAESMEVVYNEELYNQDLIFFETILNSFSVDADTVSENSIIENFLAGRTLCAIIDTDSLSRLSGYSYSLMEIPNLNESLSAASCATTDMLLVNEFSAQQQAASDFARYVTTGLAGELNEMTGHYSVIRSENPEWTEEVAYQAYESAVLVPSSQDAKDFWVDLKETISKYF